MDLSDFFNFIYSLVRKSPKNTAKNNERTSIAQPVGNTNSIDGIVYAKCYRCGEKREFKPIASVLIEGIKRERMFQCHYCKANVTQKYIDHHRD